LNEAIGGVYHFVWSELADWYVEQVKPRLYGTLRGGAEARAVLAYAYQTALRLLHPFMPFVTEELWSHLAGADQPLLAAARWAETVPTLIDAEAERRFSVVQEVVSAVRNIRAEYGVAPGQAVRAMVQPASLDAAEACNAEQGTIERMARIGRLESGAAPAGVVGAHAVLADGSSLFVSLGDAIDVTRECARLQAELDRVDQLLGGVARTLGNENFLRRAPPDVVERERAKEATWREQRAALAGKLHVLGC
jgi:valyl-tRNA synthetase